MFITDLSIIVITLHDTTLRFMLLHVYHRSIYNSHTIHDTTLRFMLLHVYHRSIYNSHNITRYYTMIYVTTCLSQIYHIIVITLHDTTL